MSRGLGDVYKRQVVVTVVVATTIMRTTAIPAIWAVECVTA